ncbi:MAG: DNA/RNA non-specific endonuclease [Myxococcota bacterium]
MSFDSMTSSPMGLLVRTLRVSLFVAALSSASGCAPPPKPPECPETKSAKLATSSTLRPAVKTREPTPTRTDNKPHPTSRRRIARVSRYASQQVGLTRQQKQSIRNHCPFGAPALAPQWEHGPTQVVARGGYALRHSSVDLIPLWVCEGLTKAQLDGPLKRPESDLFKPDPELPEGERSERSDYKRSGYDRGHLAPSADQTVDVQLQAETFFLSNVAPQVGVAFNRNVWKTLEGKARDWIRDAGSGYVITGPIFYDPKEDDPATADGFVDYFVIGANGVAVPTHFYKVVVVQRAGKTEAIGFVFENRRHESPHDFPSFIKSLDWIEEHTGLNFMPDLNPVDERRIERQPSVMW